MRFNPIGRKKVINKFLAGQSNAAADDLTDPVQPYNLKYMTKLLNTLMTKRDEQPMLHLEYNVNSGPSVGRHGSEMTYSYLANTEGYKVRSGKIAQGSTSLAVDWASGSVLRTALIDVMNYVNSKSQADYYHVEWNQYEGDAGVPERANNYASNMIAFINDVETSTNQEYTWTIIKCNPLKGGYTEAENNVIIAQQILVKEHFGDRVIITDCDSCEIQPEEPIHYSTDGIFDAGKLVWRDYANYIQNQ